MGSYPACLCFYTSNLSFLPVISSIQWSVLIQVPLGRCVPAWDVKKLFLNGHLTVLPEEKLRGLMIQDVIHSLRTIWTIPSRPSTSILLLFNTGQLWWEKYFAQASKQALKMASKWSFYNFEVPIFVVLVCLYFEVFFISFSLFLKRPRRQRKSQLESFLNLFIAGRKVISSFQSPKQIHWSNLNSCSCQSTITRNWASPCVVALNPTHKAYDAKM